MSHNIREGRLLIDAARKHKRVVQVGTQSRSTPTCMRGDRAHPARARSATSWSPRPGTASCAAASATNSRATRRPHLDFDLWLGPAPERPYQSNLLPGIWRWWYDFGAGDIGNDGVHDIDVARWGLGVTTHPSTVAALGGKYFFDDDQQFPDTQYCVFE